MVEKLEESGWVYTMQKPYPECANPEQPARLSHSVAHCAIVRPARPIPVQYCAHLHREVCGVKHSPKKRVPQAAELSMHSPSCCR